MQRKHFTTDLEDNRLTFLDSLDIKPSDPPCLTTEQLDDDGLVPLQVVPPVSPGRHHVSLVCGVLLRHVVGFCDLIMVRYSETEHDYVTTVTLLVSSWSHSKRDRRNS